MRMIGLKFFPASRVLYSTELIRAFYSIRQHITVMLENKFFKSEFFT